MCGRYTLTSPHGAVADYFETGTAPELPPRYNLAPSQESLIVTPTDQESRHALCAHWGLTLARGGKGRLVINARSEDIEQRPAFREGFVRRRCLVPANGFFEWTKIGRTKQPYYFTSPSSPLLGLAGLWSEDAAGRLSFVILTTIANHVVGRIHDRMPVILSKRHQADWLQQQRLPSSLTEAMFQPWPDAETKSQAVGMRVNDAAVDELDCIKPLAGPVDLFTD